MWPNIKFDFLEMVKEERNTKHLSDSQNKEVIRIIFKKEDRSDLKFYRPISLLNNHQNPCSIVLPSITGNDQTCIPGRNIASNLHTLNDIVKYTNSKNIEEAILFLDQEKAFDRVDHQFLIKTLKHLNFGDYFISWIEIILKDITSCVKITKWLPYRRNRNNKRCSSRRPFKYSIICHYSRGFGKSNQIKSKHQKHRTKDSSIC